jgi:hypothetical protein
MYRALVDPSEADSIPAVFNLNCPLLAEWSLCGLALPARLSAKGCELFETQLWLRKPAPACFQLGAPLNSPVAILLEMANGVCE